MTSKNDGDAERQTAEVTTGWRHVFSLAPAYRFAQLAIGAGIMRTAVVNEILHVTPEDRILDIGCGTADILESLPPVDYLGFDPSERYIADAAARFGDRGQFTTSTASHFAGSSGDRTIAFAIGVFHHMPDAEVREALALARQALAPGGRFVSVDPTLVDGQHPIARFLVSRDRGQHVRTPDEVLALVRDEFPDASVSVRHDLLRPPYSHVIAEAVS